MAEGFAKPSLLILEGNVAENWRRFKQKFEIYLVASGHDKKTKKEKTCILLNLAGEQAIEIYNTFAYVEDESEDIDVVIRKFEEYCNRKRNVMYERHVFNTRSQGSVETIDAFVTELRLQANNYEFGSLRDELLRDRLVVGIRSDSVRSRLFREADLMVQKAIDICRAAEVTDSRMASIKNSLDSNVNALDKDNKYSKHRQRDNKTKRINEASQQSKMLCKNCGNKHIREKNKCPAYGKSCKECGKKNHFAKMCKNKDKPIHDTRCSDLFIGTLSEINDVTASNDEWNSTLQIEGKAVKVKLDTGAKYNVLPKTIYNTLNSSNKIIPTDTKLIAYSGDTIEAL